MSSRLGFACGCLVVLLSATGGQVAGGQTAAGLHSGEWLISGSGGVGRSHDGPTDTDVTHIAVSPSGLVFLTDRFAVGGSVGLSYSSYTGGSSHSISIGPAARYYFASGADGWLPFVAAAVMPRWSSGNSTAVIVGTQTTLSSSSRSTMIDGSVGLTRLLERHVGVTGEAYYTRIDFSSSTISTATASSGGTYDVGLRFGLSVFVH